jgi:hypothetical protein
MGRLGFAGDQAAFAQKLRLMVSGVTKMSVGLGW